jgi:hypothetical protein
MCGWEVLDMKKIRMLLLFFAAAAAFVPALGAQSLKAMSLNGATGLFTIPTGRIAWEQAADLAVDLGGTYNFVHKNPIAKGAVNLFRWMEVSTAFDFQPQVQHDKPFDNSDAILGLKIQFPARSTAIALGGNMQIINRYPVAAEVLGQVYLAATYAGQVFAMPAETTVVLGYTIRENAAANIDYGMGFDLTLLPDIFQGFLHWIIDFSNFSYSAQPLGADAYNRGCLNTGLRIDIGAIPAMEKFKLSVDVIVTDAFDEDRSFVLGAMFGLSIL